MQRKRHTECLVSYFDGACLWLMTRRLEKGAFFWPKAAESGHGGLKLTPEVFALLTDGIDMHGASLADGIRWSEKTFLSSPQPGAKLVRVLLLFIAALNTLQKRSLAAPGLLAQIIVAKYCDHLPLYRQEQIYATRNGIVIPRQSTARWLGLSADWLRPIYEHIHTGVMAGSYDETPEEYPVPATARRNKVTYGPAKDLARA